MGGLMLTLFLAIYAGLIAIPLGIPAGARPPIAPAGDPLRLDRVHRVWRGVPIIAVIFLASLLLPLIV